MNDRRKPGRPATGRSTKQVRIPIVLEPAVRELVATYERVRWQTPARQLGQATQEQQARELAQKILDTPEQERREFIAHITDNERQQAALNSGNVALYAAMLVLRLELEQGNSPNEQTTKTRKS